jgi:hypothetical protein
VGGEYDIYIVLASHHNWTPEQVNELPVDYIEELLAYHEAVGRARKEASKK